MPSTTVSPNRQRSAQRPGFPRTIIALMATLGFLAAGGIQGGVAMLLDPLTPLGMSTEYLAGTPIDTYLLAGWFLVGMAGASLLTLTGLLVRWSWRWANPIERGSGVAGRGWVRSHPEPCCLPSRSSNCSWFRSIF